MAIVINLMVSLVTVIASLVFRTGFHLVERAGQHMWVALNLLAGSLIGSRLGVHYAKRMPERMLARAVTALLIVLSLVLMWHDLLFATGTLSMPTVLLILLGVVAGLGIGMISSLLGVAGGEMIIPTLVLLFGLPMKEAGTVSLVISIPTILMGLYHYWRQPVFTSAATEQLFLRWMATGSVLGSWVGSLLLPHVPGQALHWFLGAILMLSALKMMLKKGR